jgi:aryl-alcohol dehydrogenase-like predicted oxidoreductase
METRKLGDMGPEVSEIGLGTMGMTAMYGTPDDEESVATIHRALELGVTHFDTADMYGPWTGEKLVGRALRDHRDDVVLATKFGALEIDDQGAIAIGADGKPHPNGHPDYTRMSIEGSLTRLGTDYLDIYYLHRVDPEVPVEETFGVLGELVREGKVRHLGISEAGPESIRRARATAPLTMVQTEYSLFTRTVESNGVLATVRELGLGFVAYSPLGRGVLTGALRSLDGLPDSDVRRNVPRFQGENFEHNLALARRAEAVAAELEVAPAQLAIAWVLAQGDDIVAIPGTKRRTYLEQNIGAASLELDDGLLAALDAAIPEGSTVGQRYPAAVMAWVEE